MILYFSGTGNTKYLAEHLAKILNDKLYNLECFNEEIRDNQDKNLIIMSPVYAWGLPRIVVDFLSKLPILKNINIYFLLTMGENYGNIEAKIKKIIANKSANYKGLFGFIMPNNYFVGAKIDPIDKQVNIIRNSCLELQNIANDIILGNSIFDDKKKRGGIFLRLFSNTINYFFSKYGNKIHKFSVSNECIRCLECVKKCPVKNIELKNDEITFNNRCISCLRCVSICPKNAIDINGKNKTNGIYHFPNMSDYEKN